MPAAESSLRITEAYRSRLFAIRGGLEGRAVALWNAADDLNDFTWTNRAAAAVEQAQNEAVALTGGYLSAFLSSEVGTRTRGPTLDRRRYSGLSRDGRPLRDALRSPMIGFRLKLAEGESVEAALKFGLDRAKRMVSVDYDHAHRTALTDGLAADERFQGWQRAVTGTCGACAGDIAVEVSTNLPSVPLQVHPNCQCVTEPVIMPRATPAEMAQGATAYVQGSTKINRPLWAGEELQGTQAQQARWLDAAIESSNLDAGTVVYRGMPLDMGPVEVGQTLYSRGYMSTTPSLDRAAFYSEGIYGDAMPTLLRITVGPRGGKAADMEKLVPEGEVRKTLDLEPELVFGRGSGVKVTKITEERFESPLYGVDKLVRIIDVEV